MRKNSKLKEYCSELQGEIENIWGQANQRISALTAKMRGKSHPLPTRHWHDVDTSNGVSDMEREEQALRRKCEDLRLTLENRTRELSQSQELYSKLKQRVLMSQAQELPPSVARSRTPIQAPGSGDGGHGPAQSQLPRPIMPVSAPTGAPNYFPASPAYAKAQPSSAALVEWNKPSAFSQRTAFPYFTSEATG